MYNNILKYRTYNYIFNITLLLHISVFLLKNILINDYLLQVESKRVLESYYSHFSEAKKIERIKKALS